MLERPSKEAWDSWLRSGVTQWYLTEVNEVREALKEAIVNGQAGLENQLVGTIGVCEGIKRVMDTAREYPKQFTNNANEEIDANDD